MALFRQSPWSSGIYTNLWQRYSSSRRVVLVIGLLMLLLVAECIVAGEKNSTTFVGDQRSSSSHRFLSLEDKRRRLNNHHGTRRRHHHAHSCGTRETDEATDAMNTAMEHWEHGHNATSRMLRGGNGGKPKNTKKYRIKTYVHVMQPSSKVEVTNPIIDNMIGYTNRKLAGSAFSFTLVKINRVVNKKYYTCRGRIPNEAFKKFNVKGTDVLNIYFCDLNYLGYASLPSDLRYFPSTDGVVISVDQPPLGYQVTAVHEIGHWLGLEHTFHGGCGDVKGDGVSDTPAHKQPLKGWSGYKSCFAGERLNTCPDKPGLDPVLNFMSYGTDPCLDRHGAFTQGQITRMLAMHEEFRVKRAIGEKCSADKECESGVWCMGPQPKTCQRLG